MHPVLCPAASIKPLQNMQSSLSEGDEKFPVPNSALAEGFPWWFLGWGWADLPAWAECFVLWFYRVGSQAWTGLSPDFRRAPGPFPHFSFPAVRSLGAAELQKQGLSGDGTTLTLCENHTSHCARQVMTKLSSFFLVSETRVWPSWAHSSQGLKPYFSIWLPFAGLFFWI